MRYPTQRAKAVNSETVTIAAPRQSRWPISAVVVALVGGAATAFAQPAPPTSDAGQIGAPRSAASSTASGLTAASDDVLARGAERVPERGDEAGGDCSALRDGCAPPTRPSAGGEGSSAATTTLDGTRVLLAPQVAWAQAARGGDSLVGAELALATTRERRTLAACGVRVGAARYAKGDAGRVWIAALAGTRRATGALLGAELGAALELSAHAHARPGLSIGVWVYAAVVPFVRVVAVRDQGVVADVGITLPLPIARW